MKCLIINKEVEEIPEINMKHLVYAKVETGSMQKRMMQGLVNFFLNDQKVTILGFVGHIVSVATTQLCWCNMK